MRRAAASLLIATVASCSPPSESPDQEAAEGLAVAERLAKFAPTELRADLSGLADSDRQVLAELVTAARQMDEIFLRQVWTGNADLRAKLAELSGPGFEAAREYFAINFGDHGGVFRLACADLLEAGRRRGGLRDLGLPNVAGGVSG